MADMLQEYLTKYKTMSLATVSALGTVDCSSVYFSFDRTGRLYFAAHESTPKAKNLRATGHFAVAMDDGGITAVGVKLSGGEAKELVSSADIAATRESLNARHPGIASFLEKEGNVFFRLSPSRRTVINFSWGVNWRLDV